MPNCGFYMLHFNFLESFGDKNDLYMKIKLTYHEKKSLIKERSNQYHKIETSNHWCIPKHRFQTLKELDITTAFPNKVRIFQAKNH